METSLFMGSILGPLMLAIGMGILLNPKLYKKMATNLASEPIALYVASLAGFVVGFLMIHEHNIWEVSWRVIITLLAWAIFIKSALLLVLPGYFDNWLKKTPGWTHFIIPAGALYAGVGLILIYITLL